ncbi:MAG: hypothetical protein QOE34_672 [Verrucomicrobiota bacterium]
MKLLIAIFDQPKPKSGEPPAPEKMKVPRERNHYGISHCACYDAHDRRLRLHHWAFAARC